jgi:HEAT repeat protein
LAAAGVNPDVLFPLIVEFSGNKEVGFSDRAVEALASMLERDEKAPDEVKATEILVAGSKPPAGNSTRIAAARGLGKLKNKQAVETLAGMLSDSARLVRKFAIEGLKPLAGQDFGYAYAVEPGSQQEAIAKWGAWVKTYEPKAP